MGSVLDVLCQYKSIRLMRVRNKKIASVYYSILLLVLAYVVGYTIIYQKGYQASDNVSGTSAPKLKGSGSIGNATTNRSEILSQLKPLDAMDLVTPDMEENAFFLATSITITPNQTQTTCDGHIDDAPHCTTEDTINCTHEFYSWDSQGIYTGECGTNNRCQLYSWCPLEDDTDFEIVNNVGAFTVFVKLDVSFDAFDITRTNTYDKEGNGHPVIGYNLFTIDGMLDKATKGNGESRGGHITDYRQIAEDGAIIMVSSVWNCDFDQAMHKCNPEYRLHRIDSEPDTISSGFNFRSTSYDVDMKYRLLQKLHGIRVIFIVEGYGSKFDLVALSVTLGAGLAYIGVATLLTDIILENFLGTESDKYEAMKYREADDIEVDEFDGGTHEVAGDHSSEIPLQPQNPQSP